MNRTALGFFCAGTLALARVAHALPVIQNPLDVENACASMAVAGNMQDPNTVTTFSLAGPEGCVKLCKRATKECKSYVKDALSCQQRHTDDDKDYNDKTCEVLFEGSDVKTCKKSVSSSIKDLKDVLKATRDTQDAACEQWGTTCQTVCNGPG